MGYYLAIKRNNVPNVKETSFCIDCGNNLKSGGTTIRHWFSFNKEIERIAPCGYLAEELTD